MPGHIKPIYALDSWTVEKRHNGWFFARTGTKRGRRWRGPYRSEASVTLSIARELRKELATRHQRLIHTMQH